VATDFKGADSAAGGGTVPPVFVPDFFLQEMASILNSNRPVSNFFKVVIVFVQPKIMKERLHSTVFVE
jgi:hypothetical protein